MTWLFLFSTIIRANSSASESTNKTLLVSSVLDLKQQVQNHHNPNMIKMSSPDDQAVADQPPADQQPQQHPEEQQPEEQQPEEQQEQEQQQDDNQPVEPVVAAAAVVDVQPDEPIQPEPNPLLDREYAYIQKVIDEFSLIRVWNDKFVAYLRARLQPILLQLKDTHVQLADGQSSLQCLDQLIDQLILIYDAQRKVVIKTGMNGKPLAKTMGNRPVTTESAQTDTATLQLAALTSEIYGQITQDDAMLDFLKKAKKEIKPLLREYKSKHLFAQIEICEQYEKQSATALEAYRTAIDQYKTILDTSGIDGVLVYYNGKYRPNLHQLKHQYIKSIHQFYTKHLILCKLVFEQTNLYLEEDKIRSLWMSQIILKITQQKISYHTQLAQKFTTLQTIQKTHAPPQAERAAKYIVAQKEQHRQSLEGKPKMGLPMIVYSEPENQSFINVNPILPAPVPHILNSSSTSKYFHDMDIVLNVDTALATAKNHEKPGEFPQNTADSTILAKTTCKMGSVMTTDYELLYTPTHHLVIVPIKKTQQMFDQLEKDLQRSVEKNLVQIKLTPPPTDETGATLPVSPIPTAEQTLVSSPYVVSSLHQINESISTFGEPDYTVDGTILIATPGKKDDQIVVREKKTSFFSFEHEYKLTFKDATIAKEWMELINENSYVAPKPEQQQGDDTTAAAAAQDDKNEPAKQDQANDDVDNQQGGEPQ